EDKADLAFKQLIGEDVVELPQVAIFTALKTQGVVFNRLDRIREIELQNLTPPAAGEGEELNRVWAGAFGVWADADNKNGIFGFEYEGGGVAVGFDRQFDGLPGLRLGLSAAFSNGTFKNNNGLTNADVDTLGLGVYGSYILSNGLFFDATVAYAKANNLYTTRRILGGLETGDFDVDTWQLGGRVGYVYKTGAWQFIPSVGVKYLTAKQDAWTESLVGATGSVNSFTATTDHELDIPIQLKINTTITKGSATITPELRLGYTIVADKLSNHLNTGFGTSDTYPDQRPRSIRNTFQVGAGIKINTGGPVDFFANYDLDVASGYKSHNASLGLGIEF
ncbi:MAG: autotransporter outer membrane beta-barrel domain-containing protein, partial [Deltaproteobacteria bacterium]|nr:autotransporter outer membrane beta-barrel domain-containing protein [Deltaproteobacteria bacterium]